MNICGTPLLVCAYWVLKSGWIFCHIYAYSLAFELSISLWILIHPPAAHCFETEPVVYGLCFLLIFHKKNLHDLHFKPMIYAYLMSIRILPTTKSFLFMRSHRLTVSHKY